MQIPFSISILVVLAVIAIQDFRYRAVTWYLFPVGIIMLMFWNFFQSTLPLAINSMIINTALLCSQLILLVLFFQLKSVNISDLFKRFIGLGDLLFFVLLALGLPTVFFIGFFIFSLIISLLVGELVFNRNTTPLAGIQAALLFPFICLDTTGFISLHNPGSIQII